VATNDTKTKVTILTGSYRITGYIELLPGARVTDFLHESKEFVVVLDAEVSEANATGRQVLAAPFLDVNRTHIQIVTLC
jgi:hypothetical protein